MHHHHRLCELLGIKYPILLGGMAWAGTPELAAAVSNAGGLGLLGAGSHPSDELRRQIRRVRELTDKPFGVNIVPLGVPMAERAEVLIEEGIGIAATGFTDPTMPIVSELRRNNIIVLAVVPTVRLARRMEAEGAHVIIASGTEGGGHVGKIATLALVPQVVDAVKLPVVAAGGFGDARGFAAALALGACGVQMGTRFLATDECPCHPTYKERILQATEESTVVTGDISGKPMRVLRNRFTDEWLQKERAGIPVEELLQFGVGKIRLAVCEGEVDMGSMPTGQVAGMIQEVLSVQAVIERMVGGAREILSSLTPWY